MAVHMWIHISIQMWVRMPVGMCMHMSIHKWINSVGLGINRHRSDGLQHGRRH